MSNAESPADTTILDDGPPFDTTGLALVLRISPRTPERWRAQGTGPKYILVGGRVRYFRRDVAAWLASRRRECTRERT